jgi:hypothetical protein
MKHCCDSMAYHANYRCAEHPDPFDCPDNIICYSAKFGEYGIIIHDGGSAHLSIEYCPWCGSRLPESERDRWRDELAALGFDEPFDQEIPSRYKTGEWRGA